MGCYTIYIVRERDGTLRWDGQRWGNLELATGADLLAHVETLNLRPTSPGFFARSWCRGWYIDRASNVARVYGCGTQNPPELPAWPDWDVAIAPERRFDILELIGEPDDGDEHIQFVDAWRGAAAAHLLTTTAEDFPHRWDPLRQRLEYAFYYHDGCDISVVDHDGRVTDYGFADSSALFAALGHGHVLVDELATCAPCPEPFSERMGAVIDVRVKTVFVWHQQPIAASTYALLRERWPGWRVIRDVSDGALFAPLPRAIDAVQMDDFEAQTRS